ncbi:MAG TPA: hypothetical protein VMX15_02895 [Candidatus Heimdallarchaeota archaeon]|nr:hypothetical protein [Candidatus Heimdallarchaeota archaeon]
MNIGKPGKWRIRLSWRYPWIKWFPTPQVTITIENATQEGGATMVLTLDPSSGDKWSSDPATLEGVRRSIMDAIENHEGWTKLNLPRLTRLSRGWIW